tara:strand:- start:423 stop:788 length:366 start_codon:yes stop_codon:yes gene_type:complete
MNFKLRSGNKTSFKQMGSKASPAKEQVVEGVLCDAYGNPKPSAEQIKAGTATPDFRNKAKKGKQEKGLGPGFGDSKAEQKTKAKADEKSEEARKAEIKAKKKQQDAETMESSIDMTLGKNK